jgi:hypothetical protein
MSTIIDKTRETHPSYGVIEMTRIGGCTPRLVGSVADVHHTAIRIALYRGRRAEAAFGDGDHWMAAGAPLAVVEMSLLQWAELITLTGMGVQTPCTLVEVAGETQPHPPEHDSRMERVIQESRAELFEGPDASDAARAELRALQAEIDALKIPKAAKRAMSDRLQAAQSALRAPSIVAHVAVERMARHLETAATEARIQARASNEPAGHAGNAIDGAAAEVRRMLPARAED